MKRDDAVVLITLALALALALLFQPARPDPVRIGPRAHGEAPGILWREGEAFVDLNTADAALLDELPGIGAALAQAIAREREEGGAFSSADDLARVRGIGPAKIEALREAVAVAP